MPSSYAPQVHACFKVRVAQLCGFSLLLLGTVGPIALNAYAEIEITQPGRPQLQGVSYHQGILHFEGQGLSAKPIIQSLPLNSPAQEADSLMEDGVVPAGEPGGVRMTIDIPQAVLGNRLPMDGVLAERLLAQWPEFRSIRIVALEGGATPGVRVIVDLAKLSRSVSVGYGGVTYGSAPKTRVALYPKAKPASRPPSPLLAQAKAPVKPVEAIQRVARNKPLPSAATQASPSQTVNLASQDEGSQAPLNLLAIRALPAMDVLPSELSLRLVRKPIIAPDNDRESTPAVAMGVPSSIVLKSAPADAQTPKAGLISSRQSLAHALQQIQAEKARLAAQNSALKSQLGQKILMMDRLQAQTHQLQAQHPAETSPPNTQLAQALSAAKAGLQQAMQIIQQQNAQLARLKNQITLVSQDMDATHRDQMTHLTEKLEAAEAELKSIKKAQLAQAMPAVSSQAFEQLQEKIAVLTQEKTALLAQDAQLKQHWQSVQQEIALLKTRQTQQQTQLLAQQLQARIASLSEKNRHLVNQLTRLTAEQSAQARREHLLQAALQTSLQAARSQPITAAAIAAPDTTRPSATPVLSVTLNPGLPPVTTLPMVSGDAVTQKVLAEAERLQAQNRLDEAARLLEQAVRQQPGQHALQAAWGKVLLKQGRLQQADTVLRQTMDAQTLCNYAITLKKLGQLDQAESVLRLAVAVSPDTPEIRYNLASVYLSENKLEDAKIELLQTLKKAPHFAEAHYQLGLVYAKQNETKLAARQWQQFLALDPNSSKASLLRPMLAQQAASRR